MSYDTPEVMLFLFFQEFLVEIAAREVQFKDIFAEAEKLIAASNEDEESALKEKMQNLRHRRDHLNDATSQRQTNLIEALVLAQQFSDTVREVKNRLSGMMLDSLAARLCEI